MFQLAKPLFLITETPLHAGSGDSLGVVDMPIQRERHTSFPKIEASSLKGAIREVFEEKQGITNPDLLILFGKEDGDVTAGSIAFTDSRLLLFPIKSMKGVFAWITCERVLKQFANDMNLAMQTESPKKTFSISNVSNISGENKCYILGNDSQLKISGENIVLEEYAFTNQVEANTPKVEVTITDESGNKTNQTPVELQTWVADKLFTAESYWYKKAQSSIVVLSNDDFKDFVNLSTEVITRTKINNDTGTVQPGALFTEEYLPTESVLYSLVMTSPEFSKNTTKKDAKQNMQFFDNIPNVFQLGGNATLGKGIIRTVFEKTV